MGFDCRAGYGRRRDQTDLRAIEAREQARYEALARRKERGSAKEAHPKAVKTTTARLQARAREDRQATVNFPPKSKTVFLH